MEDETADVSNKEQVAVCIRWVDENLCAHEDFVGMKPVARSTADEIVNVIADTLAEMNLRLEDGNVTMVRTRCQVTSQKFAHK